MIHIATARTPTTSASKYPQQACKHWEHNLPVLFDNMHDQITLAKDKCRVNWPTNVEVTLALEGDNLVCMVNVSADGQRDGVKGALERHIDRIACRETPLKYEGIDR